MEQCFQFPGMSVYEHGEDVHEWFVDLYNHIMHNTELEKPWRLPNWILNPLIKQNLLPLNILRTYQLWHDIGKPRCRIVDEEGKQHFPNHAEISEKLWNEMNGDPQVGWLIGHDMDAHTVKGEQIESFLSRPESMSQILTALAEIHSNANHLGQLDSTNFKIKFKQLDKLGKKYIASRSNAKDIS